MVNLQQEGGRKQGNGVEGKGAGAEQSKDVRPKSSLVLPASPPARKHQGCGGTTITKAINLDAIADSETTHPKVVNLSPAPITQIAVLSIDHREAFGEALLDVTQVNDLVNWLAPNA